MILTVVREYKWLPGQTGSLFIDDQDVFGLEYHYNDIVNQIERIKNPPKNPEDTGTPKRRRK